MFGGLEFELAGFDALGASLVGLAFGVRAGGFVD